MRIEDFPRPKDDNGRGVHWSARLYHDDVQPSLDYWVDQLVAMKMKWLKVLDDGGGSSMELCRKLVAADIMPVVRFYLPELNPSHLKGRELDTVSRYVGEGVYYFESNNEPDLAAEWRDGKKPSNWKEIVVDNFIRDADGVLGRGGYLALPAMGPGSRDNPIAIVVQKGRRDLFERGCWVAIHNYTLNHPLDYPDDDVNQQGRPLTQAAYEEYGRWRYSHLTYDEIVAQGISLTRDNYDKYQRWAWDGRTIDMVNQLRAERKNPGDTIFDDPNCFRGWEAAGKMMVDALGFHVPVISTEGGPVLGWGDDLRYAKVSAATQMKWQLEIVRFMQSQAPPWYFSCCTWLLAAGPLGDYNPTWEQMSWYTHTWDEQFGLNGQLPIVQALKDEPTVVRPELRSGNAVIQGTVRNAANQPVGGLELRLQSQNRDIPTITDHSGSFRFVGLAAGTYAILSGNTSLVEDILLEADATETVDITLGQGQQSAIEGLVSDTVGNPRPSLDLIVGEGEQQLATVQTDHRGYYQVEGLSAGSYWIITAQGDAARAAIQLDGWNRQSVDLTVPAPSGYRYAVVTKRLLSPEETGNERKLYGRVLDQSGEGMNGVLVEMAWENAAPGTQFPRQTTPKDPFKAAGNFEFLHSPGVFLLRVTQGDWPGDVADQLITGDVPGREGDPITYEVEFQLVPSGGETGSAEISGVIANGAGLGLNLFLNPPEGQTGRRTWATVLPTGGNYSFTDLPGGQYELELENEGTIKTLELEPGSRVAVDHTAGPPMPTTGAIAGTLSDHAGAPAAGLRVLLYREETLLSEQLTEALGQFRFTDLQSGVYRVDVDDLGTLSEGIAVAAGDTVILDLSLPAPDGGSTIQGQLRYSNGDPGAGLPVWTTSQDDLIATTTSTDDGSFIIQNLPAGSYDLFFEHPVLGQRTLQLDLVLDGQGTAVLAYTDLPPVTTGKPLADYYLFGTGPDDQLLLEIALPYLRAQGVTTGFQLAEARHAASVTIVGDENVAGTADEQALRDAGCQVHRLPGDPFTLAEELEL